MEKLRNFKLAGDYYLWNCFSNSTKLDIISAVLSGFRTRRCQLSRSIAGGYMKEQEQISPASVSVFDRIVIFLDKFCWHHSLRFNKNIFLYSVDDDIWKRNN